MIRTVELIEIESKDDYLTDIKFIVDNLQCLNYSVSQRNIEQFADLSVEELQRSVQYNDVSILVCENSVINSTMLWEVISKVFCQPIDGNGLMYSKWFEYPGIHPVVYQQGLYVLTYDCLRLIFIYTLLPILKNFNADLDFSIFMYIKNVTPDELLQLLPQFEPREVGLDYRSSGNGCTLHLNSTNMSALLGYKKFVTRTFWKVKCNIDTKISKLVYDQNDLHIKQSVTCIEECFKRYLPEDVFVSFNGGKDCTVLLHLILGVLKKMYHNFRGRVFCVYVENSNPFEELNKFIEICREYYDLEILTLNKSIKESLSLMLETNPNMKAVLMGTRKTDPFSDHLESFHMTDKDWPQLMRVSPLLDWHYSQIWDYLLHMKVPYCALYDQGYTSLGSASNTVPNPFLLDHKRNKYLPAYKLLDASKERSGRNS